MRKPDKALLVLVAGLGMASLQAQAAGPSELRGENGSTFAMTVSRDAPNLLMVQGDRITGVTSRGEDIPGTEKTDGGAVMFSASADKPFTFVVETASGQVFSLRATPVKGQGRVYRITPETPVSHPAARAWERGSPYEDLLTTLNQGALSGRLPEGYTLADNRERDVVLKGPGRATRLRVWEGGSLRVEQYRVTNPYQWSLALNERDWRDRGVRSVMFWPRAAVLPGAASVMLYIVREQEAER